MSLNYEFAARWHKIKTALQNQAEIELAYVLELHQAALDNLEETIDERRRAVGVRSQSQTGLEWGTWHRYIEVLDTRIEHLRTQVSDLESMVTNRRADLGIAYLEERKWQQLVEKLVRDRQGQQMRGAQREMDEAAVLKGTRGQLW